jgi:hypothetical protein
MVEADGADLFVGQNEVVPMPARADFGVPPVFRIETKGRMDAQLGRQSAHSPMQFVFVTIGLI